MDERIDISVQHQGNQFDFRVPRQVTMVRLTQLVRQALEDIKKPIAGEWQLKLKNNRIRPKAQEFLSRYPIGDGAVFIVIEGDLNEDI